MRLIQYSDCFLDPVLMCNDPVRKGDNKMILSIPKHYEIPGKY